jgi:diadenosine tetraphosphate (Ap4A) HIT family hydrolase
MSTTIPKKKPARSYLDLSQAEQKAMIVKAAEGAAKMQRDLIERYNKKVAASK